FCEAAWLGPAGAQSVLVLIAGTHGVEGFCGSAAALAWLAEKGVTGLPEDTAALIIHALNPFGFAWLRRVTEKGVDLNRNCIDFAGPLPENASYDELADALAPRAIHGAVFDTAESTIAAFKARHGDLAFRTAVTSGQYKHPRGHFYGGASPTWARNTLEAVIAQFSLMRRRTVAVIDFHTGLGPHGHGEIMSGYRPGMPAQERAERWYGRQLTNQFAHTSVSAVNSGLIEQGWQRLLGDRSVFVTLEFGTFEVEHILRALREDQWLHTFGVVDWAAAETRRIKKQIRKAFHPDTQDWNRMVLQRSREVIAMALAGLAGKH
ncbi:MAG: M14 family metallopeptidase, partial [Pseudomonadota bacterium]|nr:M14 family metallopeptidase [Pseudomonadota bacterium]